MLHEYISFDGSKINLSKEILSIDGIEELKKETGDLWQKWFAYAYLMESPHKSNLYYNIPKDLREKYVLKYLFGKEKVEIPKSTKKIREFIRKYYEEISVEIWAYNRMYEALIKAIEFLESVDLDERTKSGMPTYKPADVFSAIEKAKKALSALMEAREKVWNSLGGTSTARGGSEINYFEE
ncbi:MAG: hypothetical protein KatS3mg083_516 [Candidatus Dojkabacteria bacterium]|nr:MAG: hypothetical protein KatS3mg083_516 [Candidatus Dojkabacteria bacterium]